MRMPPYCSRCIQLELVREGFPRTDSTLCDPRNTCEQQFFKKAQLLYGNSDYCITRNENLMVPKKSCSDERKIRSLIRTIAPYRASLFYPVPVNAGSVSDHLIVHNYSDRLTGTATKCRAWIYAVNDGDDFCNPIRTNGSIRNDPLLFNIGRSRKRKEDCDETYHNVK